jgi:predicted Zn-dependent peptidase
VVIDPPVTTSILDNGLRVTTVALPHLHTATCALFIKVGSRFESTDDNGLSHFVEHMLFRGTERFPDSLALNTAVEELGATLNAETGRDYTLFSMSVEPQRVPAAIEIFAELMGRPRFSDIELERALVLEEINEDYDEDGVEINADDIARGMLFENHPLGQRIIGPKSNVERFTQADVQRHFATYYGAGNATLCIAGPIQHDDVVTHAQRSVGNLPRGPVAMSQIIAQPVGVSSFAGPQLRHVTDRGSQTSLAILFRGMPELDANYLAMATMLRILDDGMSTRLHYQLADQKGLAYSIHAAIEPLADVAVFEIAGATANNKVAILVTEIASLLGGLCAGDVTARELAKAQTRYRYETLASIDDAGSMASWFGGTALYYPPPSLSDRLAAMQAVTLDDVVAAARTVFAPDRLAIAAVGSLTKARLGELRQAVQGWPLH